MKIKNIIKRTCILLLSVSLLTGTLAILNPGTEITIQAASKNTALKKKAASIVNKQTKKSDSKKTKLQKLFKYTEKTYGYKRAMGFKPDSPKKGWEKTFAAEMFNQKGKNKGGSCYHFAAAYAFLAKQATGYPVKVVTGKTNGFSKNDKSKYQYHAWVEIKIGSTWYICDPNMDKFMEKSSGKYFLKKKTDKKIKKIYNNYKNTKSVTVKF